MVADISHPQLPNLSAAEGGSGLAELWVQPFDVTGEEDGQLTGILARPRRRLATDY